MDLGHLKYAKGSRKKVKRIGRGEGSGHGGTSTKGNKGQKARSGAHIKAWFEGGQMPIQRRLPKFGFVNIFRKPFEVVNLSVLEKLEKPGLINAEFLRLAGLINDVKSPVKILGNGEITKSIKVEVNAISASAKEKIEKAGGTVTVLGVKKTRLIKKKKAAKQTDKLL
jgi:large subunit ribosomal protein L15